MIESRYSGMMQAPAPDVAPAEAEEEDQEDQT